MRIAIVSPYDYFYPGGVGEHVRGLSAALRDRGHEVTVLAPSNVATSGVATPGYVRMGRSVPVPGNGSLAHIGLSVSLGRRVDELLDTACFDVIHYHEPLLPTVPLTVLRRHHGAKVGTFHADAGRSLGYQYGRRFLSRYFRRLHSCIAVSVPACDHIRRYFPGDYHVIPNGVDTTRFAPSRPPHQGLRRSGMFTLLFVGRLDKRKGLETLLDAYEMLRTVRSDVRLVLVGDGPKGAACRRHVARHHIPDVDFRGFVDAAMLPGYYTGADIFCAPATGQESFGIVLLEAMASGVPVVAPRLPASPRSSAMSVKACCCPLAMRRPGRGHWLPCWTTPPAGVGCARQALRLPSATTGSVLPRRSSRSTKKPVCGSGAASSPPVCQLCMAVQLGRSSTGRGRHPREQRHRLAGERVEIVWLARGHQVAVDDDLLVDNVLAHASEVVLDGLPRGQPPALDGVSADQQLWSVAYRQNGLVRDGKRLGELHGALVGTKMVGRRAAGNEQSIELVGADVVEGLVASGRDLPALPLQLLVGFEPDDDHLVAGLAKAVKGRFELGILETAVENTGDSHSGTSGSR